jgi:hypothetical protein
VLVLHARGQRFESAKLQLNKVACIAQRRCDSLVNYMVWVRVLVRAYYTIRYCYFLLLLKFYLTLLNTKCLILALGERD